MTPQALESLFSVVIQSDALQNLLGTLYLRFRIVESRDTEVSMGVEASEPLLVASSLRLPLI